MRRVVIALCLVLSACGIYSTKGKGGNVDPKDPALYSPPTKRA